jgi:O-antigen/teichoic acid export membrane protein
LKRSYDEDLVIKSLSKVGKGAGILFVGTIIGIFFNFAARVIIARFYDPSYYGLFNLFFVVLSIFLGIGTLGLTSGISRFIGYYTGSDENHKIKEVECWGLLIGVISGVCFSIVLYFIAPFISSLFSEKTVFVNYIRIASFTLPFYILLYALISVFRGHQSTKEKILFYDLGRNFLFLLFSFIAGFLALPFVGVIWSMFSATAIMSLSIFVYYLKKPKSLLITTNSFSLNPSIGKKILIFSLPLVLVGIMNQVMEWADTLMIGYYLTERAVGFYNVARPLSTFISTGLSVTIFIYAPLVAGLYARYRFKENDIIFSVLTKWICFFTLPLAMVLFFYSNEVISKSFGLEYVHAGIPLKILAIAFFINNFLGPNGATLSAYGKTRFLMYATLLAAGFNIIMNAILIPIYDIIGAAIATGISIVSINLIRTYKLYLISGIHPFKFDNIKPIITTIFSGSIIIIALTTTSISTTFQAILTFILTYIIFIIMLFVTNSLSQQDLKLLIIIEKKIGINLSFLKKLLKRFV